MATSYPTYSIVIRDAPLPPVTLRMTLRQRSMWQSFIRRARGSTPQRLLELFNQEKQKLLDKVRRGGTLTQEECDFLNRNTRRNIEKVIKDFKERVLTEMEVKPTDRAEEIQFKTDFATQLVQWLQDLLSWVGEKIRLIFARMRDAIQWCMEKTRELFDYLWSLFY